MFKKDETFIIGKPDDSRRHIDDLIFVNMDRSKSSRR